MVLGIPIEEKRFWESIERLFCIKVQSVEPRRFKVLRFSRKFAKQKEIKSNRLDLVNPHNFDEVQFFVSKLNFCLIKV